MRHTMIIQLSHLAVFHTFEDSMEFMKLIEDKVEGDIIMLSGEYKVGFTPKSEVAENFCLARVTEYEGELVV